ncbi:methyltransferase [Campylobacter hyointestinalis]|uniref:tRNA 5-methoxyuridine(34)/uridine 5-oxyacetic acid(34) synthase CmoB n=1 Tax=Campylobacter hyointestinalis TaxID=198 RepID=UPI0007C898B6|nr:tRNA 5-methoxyuridine(34)/uridine 5-oxyacetic acid(34) synthase CmoB [Campylobacter hyointestinalis]ANE32361.1 tRNA (cmo5U34)-carboxymethyltransferase [Campylobacter hyointestinalis subsp. hyointestinalis LMG 9260]QKF55523.1 tRNA (cmo5U34)-carboxymethyltransferase [Campylobacter hyointestinalis subsp. hyointestinalis]TXK47314.1 tRNA 5-methoxyuridine(34)/uridine 5-oxyacetic acid(34) synthase CmoB [Campylobacter hyointestinalis]SFT56411.1 tRNA (mo5U34)-methyltransferase [Campylobacter hyointes
MNLINERNAQLFARINALQKTNSQVKFSDKIEINLDDFSSEILNLALDLKPWRKGPFQINDLFIDSEWQSFIKFNLLKPYLNLKDKIVADVGCNNGYYMFRMLDFYPKSITGFDPSVLCFLQFSFINHFVKSNINYELLGVQDLPSYKTKFDTIFCLGVIYHRSDPIKMLKELRTSLNLGGEVFLDTMFIERDDEFVLSPKNRYSKITNIYFVPSIKALQNWCERAKFNNFEILAIKDTDLNEQRKTMWIEGESLNNFLDPNDPSLTIEGYPAPKRVYVRLT